MEGLRFDWNILSLLGLANPIEPNVIKSDLVFVFEEPLFQHGDELIDRNHMMHIEKMRWLLFIAEPVLRELVQVERSIKQYSIPVRFS